MPNSLTVIWTALPNGFTKDGAKIKLSLFATIRLTAAGGSGSLSDFPEVKNWTETVSGYQFKLKFEGVADRAATVTNDFHPEMWDALFSQRNAAATASI